MNIRRKTGQPQKIAGILNLVMSSAYLASGFFLWFSPHAVKFIPAEYVQTVAVMISIYGIFRMYRSYLQLTQRSINQ